MRYSIVIPCYNEEENLPRLIETVQELAEGKDIEFILVENGSKDNSYEVMQSLTDGISYIKIVKVEINQGLGYGIHQGILHAQGDYIGWIHADMQTPVLDIEQLFHYLKNREGKNIMVKARRHNRSSIDDFFTNCMALYCSMVFRLFLYDIQAVPVIASRSLFDEMTDMPDGFAFDMFVYWQARKRNYYVKRVPVRIFKREKGNSSWNSGLNARIRLSRYMIKAASKMAKGVFRV